MIIKLSIRVSAFFLSFFLLPAAKAERSQHYDGNTKDVGAIYFVILGRKAWLLVDCHVTRRATELH